MGKDLISVLLPALNEEMTIGSVIDSIPTGQLRDRGYEVEIIVADGNSKDKTQEISIRRGARVVVQQGRGKGLGVREAFDEIKGKYLFMMDADGTYPGHHILDMLPLLESGDYDVVLGSRINGKIQPGAMNRLNYIGNKFLTTTANFFFPNGCKISDVCTGMWGFKGPLIKELNLTAVHFEIEAEMYAKCVKNGFRIGEVPIIYRKRTTDSKLSSLKHGSRIFNQLLIEKFFSNDSVRQP